MDFGFDLFELQRIDVLFPTKVESQNKTNSFYCKMLLIISEQPVHFFWLYVEVHFSFKNELLARWSFLIILEFMRSIIHLIMFIE